MKKLFSMDSKKFINHTTEISKDDYSSDKYEEKCEIIDLYERRNGASYYFKLHKAINVIQKNDITTICEKLEAVHYINTLSGWYASRNLFEDYILGFEKGNIFYEENERGKIIFFNKDYYKFIPHKKHNYNPKTGMISVDYFEFINKGIPHEQDAFAKAVFSFKQENVYANIFYEIALYHNSKQSKFQTENINNLIEIIL